MREKALADAQSAHDKATAVVDDLKHQLAEVQAQNEDEVEMLENGSESREELMATQATLDFEICELQKQLAAYSDSDPVELERKKSELKQFQKDAEQFTDEIESMESWFKKMVQDPEAMKGLRMSLYGDEFDEEEGALRELA